MFPFSDNFRYLRLRNDKEIGQCVQCIENKRHTPCSQDQVSSTGKTYTEPLQGYIAKAVCFFYDRGWQTLLLLSFLINIFLIAHIYGLERPLLSSRSKYGLFITEDFLINRYLETNLVKLSLKPTYLHNLNGQANMRPQT